MVLLSRDQTLHSGRNPQILFVDAAAILCLRSHVNLRARGKTFYKQIIAYSIALCKRAKLPFGRVGERVEHNTFAAGYRFVITSAAFERLLCILFDLHFWSNFDYT